MALVLAAGTLIGATAVDAQEFNWRRYEGTHLNLLLNQHTYTEALLQRLQQFTDLTGITVSYDIFPEQNYFDRVTVDLSSGRGAYDVFMTGAYQVWQYAPPGWMEPLEKYINDPTMTNPDYDFEDIFPNLVAGTSWSLRVGDPVGTGSVWAIPWGFESNALMYRKDLFDELGISAPQSLPELYGIALRLNDAYDDVAGIVVRGTRNWATIHPGYMTQFASYGARDFDENLNPVMNSPAGVAMTELWMNMVREAGPAAWTTYTWYQAGADLGAGKAAMLFDADILGYFQNVPGGSAMAGRIAWAPGPRGPEGDLKTNMWIWSLAMNSASKNKGAAWYFIQWATGKEFLTDAAIHSAMVDPVRASVWENPEFQASMQRHTDFYKTFQEIIGTTAIQFTPQPLFFETTTEWAAALHEIYFERQTAQQALDNLAERIRGMLRARGVQVGQQLGRR